MKFLQYIEGKEPYMPPSGTECVTFLMDAGDLPIFGIATYLKKGEVVMDFIRNVEKPESMSPEECIFESLFCDDAMRTIKKSGFYTMEEDETGNILHTIVPGPITHWAFLEVPLSTGKPFVDACIEERMGVMNTLENMIRILDQLERQGCTPEEQIYGLKEWTKGIVLDVQRGSEEKARLVSKFKI